MSKNVKVSFIAVVLVAFAVVISGCNIFSWTHKAGSDTSDPIAMMADGDSALASGDYTSAMDYYDKAVAADPANSKARYGYVSAYLKNTGLNIIEFAKSAGNQKTIASATQGLVSLAPASAYYLIDDRTKPFGVDMKKFEGLALVLVTYLDPIAKGQCDGKIDSKDAEINLNLAFAYLLRGIFLILDPPDGNSGSIQYNVYYKDSGDYVIWDYQKNAEVPKDGNTVLNKKADAISYLDTAIARLDVAIANSIAKTSASWTDVRKALADIRTTINSYN